MTKSFNRSEQKSFRKDLRSQMPSAEVILWSKLQNRQMLGCKFRRQYGVDSFVIDFYSPELKLGIELDGDSHFREGEKKRDARRDALIGGYGIHLIRIINTEVYENLEGVLEFIAREAGRRMEELGPEVVRGRRSRRGNPP